MARILAALISVLLATQASWVQAEQLFESKGQPPLLVELYTSEGCSSCPPADQKAGQLLSRKDLWTGIVPVVFHVDYWDYLGWKDQFAQPAFSARQRQLKRDGQLRAVYTPGWVVDGNEWRGFFRGRAIPDAVARDGGQLSVERQGRRLTVDYLPPAGTDKPLVAYMTVMGFDYITEVKRGENRGLDLSHQFVVLNKQEMKEDSLESTDSDNKKQWKFDMPEVLFSGEDKNRRKAMALWVSEAGNSKPLQVVGGWLE
ncbi:DUF1223 domain-containing protein [Motiliproteus sp. MSK22-1]|uniref:DUF1223 domain-containing protein n=1 Tax=Motiliproteus sp. MSK22-1 TaxID=1897630 RepID=UPI00097629E3|nr:DUF1223 domain-containing protein [Motiliproteus sp. MSK22-1]OMH39137.1 hypothetical protein BGP75_05415 [Motiliproteus sp. MSK22-1]